MSSGRRPRQFTKTYPKRLADYMIDEEKGHGGAREQEQLDFSSDLEAPAAVDPECGALQQLPALSVTRYFEALEGPELQIPKVRTSAIFPPPHPSLSLSQCSLARALHASLMHKHLLRVSFY
jgi:hypothetical protein